MSRPRTVAALAWLAPALASATPGAEASCEVAVAPLVVTLTLAGPTPIPWTPPCVALGGYLSAGDASPATGDPAALEDRLRATGYFEQVECIAGPLEHTRRCAVIPQATIVEVEVSGAIPFPLLRQEIVRRLMLRPGMDADPSRIAKQCERVAEYLRRQGFFGAEVTPRLEVIGGAYPNLGTRLTVELGPTRRYAIGTIDVDGDAILEVATLDSRLRHNWLPWLFEQRFIPAQTDRDVAELAAELQRHGWPAAHLTWDYALDARRGTVDLVVHVRSGPRLRLHIDGNDRVSTGVLEDASTFVADGAADAYAGERTAAAMRTALQRRGHYTARVSVALQGGDGAKIEARFQIDEGPRAEIREVAFTGNTFLDAEALSDGAGLLTRPSTGCVAGRWVDAWVERDREAIRSLYLRRGFADTAVDAAYTVRPDGDLEVLFSITEGPRHSIIGVAVDGLPAELSPAEVLAELVLQPGGELQPEAREHDEGAILIALFGEGYLEASVEQRVIDGGTGTAIQVVYHVQPGPRLRFGGVLVRGNHRTSAGFIARELDLDPGDALALAGLVSTRGRLRDLGIFGSVQVETVAGAPGQPAWVLVALEERDTRTLDAVLGFSTDDYFGVGVDYADRNLFGNAVALDLQLRTGNAEGLGPPLLHIGKADRVSLRMRAPRPGGAPFDLTQQTVYQYQNKTLFSDRRLTASLSAGREVLARTRCASCPSVQLSLSYALTFARHTVRVDTGAAADPGSGTTVRLFPSIAVERTNSLVEPSSGYRANATFELAHPVLGAGLLDSRAFWRLLTAGSVYLDLGTPFAIYGTERPLFGGPVVIGLGLQYAMAQPFGPDTSLPSAEALAYGGDTSVRGLVERASIAAVPEGRYLMTGTLEVRWRLFPNTLLGAIELAGFSDAGAVATQAEALFDEVSVSAGPSLRLVTLVGPLVLSYAFPVVRAPTLVRRQPAAMPAGGRFHLTFGATL